jgi:hypothetical protein
MNEETPTTLEMIAMELCLVYTEEYALQIINQIVENTEQALQPIFVMPLMQEPSKYIMQLFPWRYTKQGEKYWARIESDMIEYEKEMHIKIINQWKEQQ